ncbi:TetR/AcrR family transcriptional regulator [Actinomadura madurae]|uniref:helix-turn-helix domain-containing protein n=1 Tax=Actinomadura madurae TaxID=1993 RepID=UPI002026F74C|nr:helix-turn-helix domain-containing protein [Actinomadura madurae]URN07243.1 TetR/AcrR family transcriptional regulator [Actinomadura madurae]
MVTASGRPGPSRARRRSSATRGRLLDAAARLIAEVGWGRVTTRAVAERAGLPMAR